MYHLLCIVSEDVAKVSKTLQHCRSSWPKGWGIWTWRWTRRRGLERAQSLEDCDLEEGLKHVCGWSGFPEEELRYTWELGAGSGWREGSEVVGGPQELALESWFTVERESWEIRLGKCAWVLGWVEKPALRFGVLDTVDGWKAVVSKLFLFPIPVTCVLEGTYGVMTVYGWFSLLRRQEGEKV